MTVRTNNKVVVLSRNEIAVSFFKFWIDYGSDPIRINFPGDIYLDEMLILANSLGYFKRPISDKSFIFIHNDGNIISEVSPVNIKDHFFNHFLRDRTEPLVFNYEGVTVSVKAEKLREEFLNRAVRLFTEKTLEYLQTHDVPELRDTRNDSYFFYRDNIAQVNTQGISIKSYSDFPELCIWRDHIMNRVLNLTHRYEESMYWHFIKNVAGESQEKQDAFKTAIGYMLNNHNHPSKGQVVICYDEVPSEAGNPMGGTGKGLFCNATKQMRNVLKVDGKKIRQDDRFRFQGVTTRTQVFWLDDVHRDFPFEVLHSVSTDGWSIERKFKDEFFIEPEKGPKIILCSNTILSGSGTTNKRRQFILEFSDFYSSLISTGAEEPIKETHGAIFFDNDYWDDQEWAKFDSFMLHCSLFYHREGLKPYTQVGKEKSRLVQSTCNDFSEWADEKLKANKDEFDSKNMFDDYKRETGDDIIQREFNRWISIYAEFNGWQLKKRKSNGRTLMKLDD